MSSISQMFRDCIANFEGKSRLEMKYSGGDSLSAMARDAICPPDRPVPADDPVSGNDSLSELVEKVRGGIREQVGDAPLTREERERDDMSMGEARSTGRKLCDNLSTTNAVRQYCRSVGIGRGLEAYVVEGFKGERMRRGMSENV